MAQRLTPAVAATFAGFHAALIAVVAAWYCAVLFTGLWCEMSRLTDSLALWALGIAPAAAALVGFLFARVLLRISPALWLLSSAAAVLAAIGANVASFACIHVLFGTQELSGPTSPQGFATVVAVSDRLGIDADYRCDVRVLDANGTVVAERHCGNQGDDGPQLLRDSMRWTSPTTLEFTSRRGSERLDLR